MIVTNLFSAVKRFPAATATEFLFLLHALCAAYCILRGAYARNTTFIVKHDIPNEQTKLSYYISCRNVDIKNNCTACNS